jgi:hypothetical protein
MGLHPYDGAERRFQHTDEDRAQGLAIVAQMLHLPHPPPPEFVLYDMAFYSGGIGIVDTLAITLPADQKLWDRIVAALGAKTPEDAASDPEWADDIVWLLIDEEEPIALRDAAVQFINHKRRAFQSPCHATHQIFFTSGSNVNAWTALWGDDTQINYCGYDQG